MTKSPSRSLGRIVTSFWVFNLVFGIFIIGDWLFSSNPAVRTLFIGPTPSPTATPTITLTLTITNTFTPTSTFTPSLTIIPTGTFTPSITPTETQTPIPYSEGPITIGYSVQKRPLEVYRFGTGQTERLIVAGMHGGSEFNTIQLADQLIAYLKDHPEIVPTNVTLYILRDLNPDGEARAHDYNGRANAHNVD
ncbi:MAG: M14 family zinc carboxypeptidase, partial [Anaerolineales bacterium]